MSDKDQADSDDIFKGNFNDKTKKDEEIEQSEFTPPPSDNDKDNLDDDWEIPEKTSTTKPKTSKKKMIIGAIVIGLIVGGMAFIVEVVGKDVDLKANPIELGESVDKPKVVDKPQGSGGTKDVSSASDKVELEKTNEPIGYYMVKSKGDWYADFVDFRKVPSKIEKSGDMKINFRCFTDNFQKTSTYFGTFRNVVENTLKVDVYIADKLVQSKETSTNKALILEGSCY